MLLATILIAFSLLALGLLAFLDRYQSAADKARIERRTNRPGKLIYYDAFADQRKASPPAQPGEHRLTA